MEHNQGQNFSIGSLSLDQLKELKLEANKLIKLKQQEETQQNIDQIIKLLKDNKIPLSKLFRAIRINNAIYHSEAKDGKLRPIYYNKNNPLEVFDGVGRKPKWFKDLELQGVNLEDHLLPLENFSTPYFDD